MSNLGSQDSRGLNSRGFYSASHDSRGMYAVYEYFTDVDQTLFKNGFKMGLGPSLCRSIFSKTC